MQPGRDSALAWLLLAVAAGACRPAADDAGRTPSAAAAATETTAAPSAPSEADLAAAEAAEERENAALPADAPRIDIAFCLDGTGSMGAVIDRAKAKIEEIAAWARSGTPHPRVRFGLVVYRDRGEPNALENLGFVASAAAMRRLLAGVTATGGGDGPEHVVAGLRAAVVDLPWDEGAALRVLFLIGDAEPHLDYGLESDDQPVLASARERKIVVSTIACGEMTEAGHRYWSRIASETGGVYQALPGTSGAPTLVEMELEEAVFASLRIGAGRAGIRYSGGAVPEASPQSSSEP
jgi:hypothetical protein